MNLVSALVMLVVATTLLNCAEGAGKNKRNRKNKKKKETNDLKKQKLQGDPTDLSNLVSRCPDAGTDVSALFSGMFLSPTEIDSLVQATQEEMKPATARRAKTKYVQRNRMSKKIGTISTLAASEQKDRNCCETELKVTAPSQVMVDGKSMPVVHMNHSYQYVQEGECVIPGESCRGIGICTQIYKYAFMLLYDVELVGKVNPPVRYGRVPVKSHCECMNIGRVIK